jgi:hypothetical protein
MKLNKWYHKVAKVVLQVEYLVEQAYIIEIIHLLWIPECHLEHKSQSIIFNVGIIM